jgi:hypothetical protein
VKVLWEAVHDAARLEYKHELRSDDTIVLFCDVTFSDITLEAVDVLRIDEDGKCREICAMARPYKPIALFSGRVALAFARRGGGLGRRLVAALLVWPVEIAQRVGESVGVGLVRGGMLRGLRRASPPRAVPKGRFPEAQFRRAMETGDVEGCLASWIDDPVIDSLGPEKLGFRGQEARPFLTALLGTCDEFEYTEAIRTDDTVALFLRARFAGLTLEGIDFMRFDEQGRCTGMKVVARSNVAVSILVGRVAILLARDGGFLNGLVVRLLIAPLEFGQRKGEPLQRRLIEGAMEDILRRSGAGAR